MTLLAAPTTSRLLRVRAQPRGRTDGLRAARGVLLSCGLGLALWGLVALAFLAL